MRSEDGVIEEAEVCKVLDKWAFRVRLKNGHELVAKVIQRDRGNFGCLAIGDRLKIEISPCDLSKGRVIRKSSL